MRHIIAEPLLTDADITRIVDALRSPKGRAPASPADLKLARRIERALDIEKRIREQQEAARKAEEERRRARAANHILTKQQVGVLAAVRAGKSVFYMPWRWTNTDGTTRWEWRYVRRAGGARARMCDTLETEGLLTGGWELTEQGRARLEAFEAKHGRVGP